MILTPNIKRKRGVHTKAHQPFPIGFEVKGVFTGLSVEICCHDGIKILCDTGCYGKGSKSRGVPKIVSKDGIADYSECLTLELEESCFLAYFLGVLCIYDLNDTLVQCEEFIEAALLINSNFLECIAAYMYLKSKGWVIKSGIKFGGNFLIYKTGPAFNHASFIINVCPTSDGGYTTTKDMKGIQRIAETSDKDVMLLEVSKPTNFFFGKIFDINQFKVSETIIRRFNSTSFVQSKNLTK